MLNILYILNSSIVHKNYGCDNPNFPFNCAFTLKETIYKGIGPLMTSQLGLVSSSAPLMIVNEFLLDI